MKYVNSKRHFQFAVFFFCLLIYLAAMAAEKQPADSKVAKINGIGITREQFDRELNILLDRISKKGRQITDDQLAALKNDTLEGLINRELLYQASQKADLVVPRTDGIIRHLGEKIQ